MPVNALFDLLTSRVAAMVYAGLMLLFFIVMLVFGFQLFGLSIGPWTIVEGYKTGYFAMQKQINDPVTGFVAQVHQCKVNQEVLKTSINDQNTAIERQAAASKQQLADTEAQLVKLRPLLVQAQQTVGAITSMTRNQGEDECSFTKRIINEANQ